MALNFLKNLKAKRAAKQAQAKYQEELTEWQSESDLLTQALEIFTNAAEGKKVEDQSLVQKAGEFLIWTTTAVFHEAGRTPSRIVGATQGFSIPIVAGIRYRVGIGLVGIRYSLNSADPAKWELIDNAKITIKRNPDRFRSRNSPPDGKPLDWEVRLAIHRVSA